MDKELEYGAVFAASTTKLKRISSEHASLQQLQVDRHPQLVSTPKGYMVAFTGYVFISRHDVEDHAQGAD